MVPGWRFKGHEDFVVQELDLRVRAIRYRRERWLTPDGRTVIAPLPPGVRGHVGPELCRFVLMQYHQGQATVPRLVAQLQAISVRISKRQLVRLLIAGQDEFLAESRDVLRAGLQTATSISVDDTGAWQQGVNARQMAMFAAPPFGRLAILGLSPRGPGISLASTLRMTSPASN